MELPMVLRWEIEEAGSLILSICLYVHLTSPLFLPFLPVITKPTLLNGREAL